MGVDDAGMLKPDWVFPTVRDPSSGRRVLRLVRELGLATVCEFARCPNRGECFGEGTATFLILGKVCTRRCGFCAVAKGVPAPPDPREPSTVADAVRRLGLAYAVVTSVTRDDLHDRGAGQFAATIRAIRELTTAPPPRTHGPGPVPPSSGTDQPNPLSRSTGLNEPTPVPPSPRRGEGRVRGAAGPLVEVLVPDFAGAPGALEAVLASGPDVLNHNLETVPRLYARVRPGAVYSRSLALLCRSRELAPATPTKSGLMVGLGEKFEEIVAVMRELAAAGVSALTVGQYLQPTREGLAVERYWHPEEFAALEEAGRAAGIARVSAGPLVRSSYRARELRGA